MAFFTGVLLDFISLPVSIGFTSATSVIIIVSQLKSLLGLKFTSSTFVDNVTQVITNISNLRFGDTCLGLICIATLLVLRVGKRKNEYFHRAVGTKRFELYKLQPST
jgi:solute carrier family 26 (sodium-independent sulfate anion transporter), member 11